MKNDVMASSPAPKRETEVTLEIPPRQQVEDAMRTLINAVVPQGTAGAGRDARTKRKR